MFEIITKLKQSYGKKFPYLVAKEHQIHIRRYPLPEKLKGLATLINNERYILLNDNLKKNEEVIVTSYQVAHHLLGRTYTNYYFSKDVDIPKITNLTRSSITFL